MKESYIPRKDRRKAEAQRLAFKQMKKGATVMGTAMMSCSIGAPLFAPLEAHATESNQVALRTNTSAFISQIATYAQPVASANDLYASVMIAQAIVESGWGASGLSAAPNYNLFGIKGSYHGQTVYMDTMEYLNGRWVSKKEPFRKYPSYAESFADNAYVLRNVSLQAGVYYYSGTWKSNTSSYLDATAWLTGRYATDPSYASKLNRIISTYGLTKYDTPASGNAGGGANTGNSGNTGNNGNAGNTGNTGNTNTGGSNSGDTGSTAGKQYYTVKSGDSIWAISQKYGITMNQLRSWNNIKNDFIYPGQKLVVSNGGASTGTGNNSTGNSNNSSGNNSNSNTGNSNTGNSSSSASQYYTVKSGDSVWAISNKYGISMSQLRSWNNIKNDLIYPGQKLVVKKGTSTGSNNSSSGNTNTGSSNDNNSSSNDSSSNTSQTYTVKSGDSIWAISNKYGISMSQLRSWNNIKNDFIYPGQKLIVKKGASGSNSNNTNSGSSGSTNNSSNNSSGTSQTYTVKSGDSVWAISNKYGITMDQLRSWNNIKNDFIYPGQKLTVKKGSANSNSSSNNTNNSSSNNGSSNSSSNNSSAGTSQTYTVKSGDSVWAISNKYGITMSQLRSWNNIKNDFIYPGQKLVVKGGSSTSNDAGSTGSSNNSNNSSNANTNTGNSSSESKYYTVKSGDSVWGISKTHGISMSDFRSWNNIKNDFIYPGQKVIISKTGGTSTNTNTAESNAASNNTTTNADTYQVKSGDTLWTIAKKHGLSVDKIKSLNKLSSDMIYVGQKLKLK
ncbi:hypothetical protein IGI37_003562 [Enterococcus sp. AZ194]|uniref:LysM peptidoglycan-binding domain-containing protein n=1 Tax=Enterococcus sp. AZ194 TaxID=2774629 RepID=UPI003F217591